ncbi:MAG TPA: aminotransferase class I/II-fold pyridoxal phosphate-dependent enzyme [Ligilactobacillus acidipiscis]|uniref:Aminotransferase class I/II-fold pyridoxal phosphate-dependent enzyme n=1 Tax=Ligilactobacillus acidipiscis TaxID=89059 RepID=A0A921K2S7_9LACO|nr:aminotransferase class I/II-fold pyridoxal phosphate-dependent enzyme [Ligilactobacillus acidipiscis]
MADSEDLETFLVQAGNRTDEQKTGAVSTPVYFSTAYRHAGLGESTGYDYSRETNPTRDVLQQTLSALEKGKQAFAVSSGMAAIQLVFSKFKSHDKIVLSDDLYGGSFRYFADLHTNYQIDFILWDGQDQKFLAKKVNDPQVKAIWLETPSNPTMKEIDIRQTATIAHQYQTEVIVDNTFYTPIIQRPLEEGADIVVHSATKYLGGHNDILGGVVVCKDDKNAQIYERNLNTTGAVLDPFSCWLLLRSLKTLTLRIEKHEKNARALVAALEEEPVVKKVLYPGRGGMISFYIRDEKDVDCFLRALNVISFAESLGGVESLITVPAIQTHADLSEKQRKKKHITNDLLRLSVGIENSSALIEDLQQAFRKAAEARK